MKDVLLTTVQKLEPPVETVIREFEGKWEQIARHMHLYAHGAAGS